MKASQKSFVSRFYLNGTLVTEKVTAEGSLRFLYQNPFGILSRRVLRTHWWATLVGWYQDSWLSKRAIRPFIQKHKIIMDEFEFPAEHYKSFNDFFCRKLKPHARVINPDRTIITSPADGKLLVFPVIRPSMQFFVKTLSFNLETFLQSKELATAYDGGVMMIVRLAPYDYHRYHFPATGYAHQPRLLNGQLESVNPIVYASGVQPLTENQRVLITLDTENVDTILMIPVGAMCVGKIVHTYQADTQQIKGDETGYFAFGGSTIVLLFKPNTVQPLEPFVKNSSQGFETAVTMGEALATKY